MKPILGTLILILGTSCIPTALNDIRRQSEERIVIVTRQEFGVYWSQLERRWPAFFLSRCVTPPELPKMDDVFNMVTFIEVEASSHFPTCTYRKSSKEIRIGDDKWASGCVPHEIGHAACDLLDIGVCEDFEHPDYPSKC